MTETTQVLYPEPLEVARLRAARFAFSLALSCRTLRAAGRGDALRDRETWFNERFDELQMFVSCVCDDWQRGIVSEREAAKAIHRYLDGVRF